MKKKTMYTATCPLCGKVYHEPPAVSRRDNKTRICSECGQREAWTQMGLRRDEQDTIIAKARRVFEASKWENCEVMENVAAPVTFSPEQRETLIEQACARSFQHDEVACISLFDLELILQRGVSKCESASGN